MFAGLQGWHLLILLAVILLLFGAAKLPALAKSVGQSARVFRGEMKEMKKENDDSSPSAAPGAATAPGATTAPTVTNTATEPNSTPEPKP